MDTVITDKRPEQTAGYCVYCNRLVARDTAARCAVAGHAPEAVCGLLDLNPDGSLPHQLPPFNWAAALMPPVWGVAHGAWAGVLVLPLWIFLDSALRAANSLVSASMSARFMAWGGALLLVLGTLAFMYWLGRRGWGMAFKRQYGAGVGVLTYEEFLKRERRWYWVCVPLFAVGMTFAVVWWRMTTIL